MISRWDIVGEGTEIAAPKTSKFVAIIRSLFNVLIPSGGVKYGFTSVQEISFVITQLTIIYGDKMQLRTTFSYPIG